ncbi:MAG: 2-oxo-4-hydroxy-4-carboxy-5-ureidoimidazoline decarboxylase [Cyanobacteria bacterium P01_C01_bin.121]
MPTYTLTQLNQMDQAAFTAALGATFEETPAIASATWHQRPFTSLSQLHQAMVSCVQALSESEQLDLIRAHPDLGSRLAMADASVQEQAGAGLDQLSPAQYNQFQQLNQAYRAKFGFPFIIAVKQHTVPSILQAFTTRLNNDAEGERSQALAEIAKIAQFRLAAWIKEGSIL